MTVVFLSSTSKDLTLHRDAVYRAIEGLDGFHCVRMEDFGARDAAPKSFCLQKLAECDLFICLIGLCYGSAASNAEESYTALEYHNAGEANIPRLVFISSDEDYYQGMYHEPDILWHKQQQFRQEAASDCIRATFNEPNALATQVTGAIRNWERSKAIPSITQPDYFDRRAESLNLPFDHLPCSKATLADLNQEKIHAFFQRDSVRRQEDLLQGGSDQENLIQFGLLKDLYPTQSALLCFGRSPQAWFIGAITRCVYWRGNDTRHGYHIDRDCRGDLLAQFEASLNFLRTNLKFSRVIGREDRTEQYEIPLVALQEAIANALIHREYASRQNGEYEVRTDCVQVEIFDDRVEIKSPGALPTPMTLERLNTEGMTHPRNPLIARIFYLYGHVERVGSGIQRMQDAMHEVHLPPPRFELSEARSVKVTFERPKQIPAEIVLSDTFGNLLSQGLNAATASTKKRDLQSLLKDRNMFAHVQSPSQVQEWLQGLVPASSEQIAELAYACAELGHMDQPWLSAFLDAAQYPHPDTLVAEITARRAVNALKRSRRNTQYILISAISVLLILVVVLTTTLTSSFRPPSPGTNGCVPGSIAISGSTILAPLLQRIAQSYSSRCLGAAVTVLAKSSISSLEDVETGQAQIGASDTVSSVPTDLVDHPIAAAIFTLVASNDVNISNLSTQEIRAIYDGSITNWKSVGGPDLPITVTSRATTSSTRATFERYVLAKPEKLPVGPHHKELATTSSVVQTVQQQVGTIGYVDFVTATGTSGLHIIAIDGIPPSSLAVENNSYPFWSIEHVYTKGSPPSNSLTASFLAYLTGQSAQGVVASLGYIPYANLSGELLSHT